MDYGACNVIYYDKRAHGDWIAPDTQPPARRASAVDGAASNWPPSQLTEVERNVDVLLTSFQEVFVCQSASSCLRQVANYADRGIQRVTLVFVEIAQGDHRSSMHSALFRSISPGSSPSPEVGVGSSAIDPEEVTGIEFLQQLRQHAEKCKCAELVRPVVVISGPMRRKASLPAPFNTVGRGRSPSIPPQSWKDPASTTKFLDEGALDVLHSPMSAERIEGLTAQAYRIYKDVAKGGALFGARGRRRSSWIGTSSETKPYAYLREAMVSGLIDGICNPEHVDQEVETCEINVPKQRRAHLAEAIAQWPFSAHDYNDDELLYAVQLMLEHILTMDELEPFRLTAEGLQHFLVATRKVYNSFVLYHNFRHACDVVQATFYFLLQMGVLPPYGSQPQEPPPDDHIEKLMDPFHCLTVMIASIGHDVGHPGVNNAFLVSLSTPLAQLYSDRSVLESFHCAAYAQILRRYWPSVFGDKTLRRLMVQTIMATDMAEHGKYMEKMADLQRLLDENGRAMGDLTFKSKSEFQALLCCLLIKCADISNVPRPIDTATQWAKILTDEFVNQSDMEEELNIPTCLFGGAPQRNDMIGLGRSQIGFIDAFGDPLFRNVACILPKMHFTVVQIEKNKQTWKERIAQEEQTVLPPRASTTGFNQPQYQAQTNTHSAGTSTEPQATSTPELPSTAGTGTGSENEPPSQATPRRPSADASAPLSGLAIANVDTNARRSSLGTSALPAQANDSGSRTSSYGGFHTRHASDSRFHSSSSPINSQKQFLDGTEDSDRVPYKNHGAGSNQNIASGPDADHTKRRRSFQLNAFMSVGSFGSKNESSASRGDRANASSHTTEYSFKPAWISTLRKIRSSVNLVTKDKGSSSESTEEIRNSGDSSPLPAGQRKRQSMKFWRRRARSVGPKRQME